MQGRDGEEADRAEADDNRRVARMEARPVDAVDGHRERLHEAGILEREPGRQPVEQRGGRRDQLGEAAIPCEPDARGQRHRAAVRRAAPAVVADAAGNLGIHHRRIAGRPAGHALADRVDHPGELVARDSVREQADLVRGEIGSADATAVDAHHDLTGARLGSRDVDELEAVCLDEPDRAHPYISPSWATMRSSSEMTAGSVWTSMTLQTPLSIERSSAGRRSASRSTRSPWPPSASARRS